MVSALEDKKADNIILLDLHGLSFFTDYFVICTGTSDRHLDALVEAVAQAAKKKHRLKPPKIEGHPEHGWVLADFGSVIVHTFSPDKRKHYRLEDLWHEGKVILRIQ